MINELLAWSWKRSRTYIITYRHCSFMCTTDYYKYTHRQWKRWRRDTSWWHASFEMFVAQIIFRRGKDTYAADDRCPLNHLISMYCRQSWSSSS